MNTIFKPKISFALLFFTFSTFNILSAQIGVWNQKTNFGGFARARSISFSIGTKGYIGTGENGSDAADFWEYDSQNDTWTQKANIGNNGRSGGVGFSIGNKGYAGLGATFGQPKSDFWEYNALNNTWTQKAFFPGIGKINAVSFSIDNFGYIGTGNPTAQIGSETKQFWQYNPLNNSWLQKADFGGIQRDRAVGFSINSKGYIGTGYHFDGINPISFADFWEYNPILNSWTQKSTLPDLERNNAVSFTTSTKAYIGLGYPNKTDFWQYNPSIDSWQQINPFVGDGRLFPSAFSIGNKGYVGMGYSVGTQGTIYYNDLWEFVEQSLGLNKNESLNVFEVYPNPSSGIINVILDNDISQIILFDVLGKEKLKTKSKSIDISDFESGIYYIKVINSKGESLKKIVKN
jgi:Secretion system C-terminal sorting domain